MLVDKAMPLVTHTFLPILRLSGDKEEIEAGWEAVKKHREVVKWSNSPREKWRKRYGNFVREVEWALLEFAQVLLAEAVREKSLSVPVSPLVRKTPPRCSQK